MADTPSSSHPSSPSSSTTTANTTSIPLRASSTRLPNSRSAAIKQKPTGPAASLAAAPQRAPLPTKAAKPAAPPRPLPQLSLHPEDKMTMAAVVAPAPSPAEGPKISMTSKEWVIPPRPKPGRKPATDTPPTKRKAQNRAAQRAFRERRAARVGELEEQLDQHKDESDKKEADLKDKIHSLELDLQSFRSRCSLLENMLDRERQERIRAETEAETLRQQRDSGAFRRSSVATSHHRTRENSMASHRGSIASTRLPHPQPSKDFSISQIISPPESMDTSSNPTSGDHITCGSCSPNGHCACAEQVLADSANGCGKCSFGTTCECLEEVSKGAAASHELKRPSSPSRPFQADKRLKISARAGEVETDFTASFSHKSSSASQLPPSILMTDMPSLDTNAFKEDCGFCKDGTYCVCADAAMATPAMTPTDTTPPTLQQVQTPPPSEADVGPLPPPFIMEMTADGAVKLPARKNHKPALPSSSKPSGGCGPNGPGSCATCQADPKAGLFCRLMAAKFNGEKSSSGGGCCGGKGAGGGCCKNKNKGPSNNAEEKVTLPSLPSLGLSYAEAYQTLSSHRNFDKAADDIGSWLPKLKTAQRNRATVEVEAASIMSVLKEFDIRFGREC